jgi:GNAT superfamily N-acetyltransferase
MDKGQQSSRAFHLDEVGPLTSEVTLAEGRELLLEYGRFVIAQPGAARFCFGALEQEAARLPLSFIEQGGGCLIAHVESAPAGFVAWREMPLTIAREAWELKRLWVSPVARGMGLGRTLTQAVLDRAVAAGKRAVYLDTAPASMAAAHRLYLEMGFESCAAYNDNPVEGLVWLVKRLGVESLAKRATPGS